MDVGERVADGTANARPPHPACNLVNLFVCCNSSGHSVKGCDRPAEVAHACHAPAAEGNAPPTEAMRQPLMYCNSNAHIDLRRVSVTAREYETTDAARPTLY